MVLHDGARNGEGETRILCSRNGCRDVIGKNEVDAVGLWNAPKEPK